MKLEQQLALAFFLLPIGYVISWFIPHRCDHCRGWIVPGITRGDHYGYGGYLHPECKDAFFEGDFTKRVETVNQSKLENSRPISGLGRFCLDESWLGVLVLAVIVVTFFSGSILWGVISGLLAAMLTRATAMIILRKMGIDPQRVKRHLPCWPR